MTENEQHAPLDPEGGCDLKRPSNTKAPFLKRFLRVATLLWFLVSIYWMMMALLVILAEGRLSAVHVLLTGLAFLSLFLSVYVARRLSYAICRIERPRRMKHNKWLVAAIIAAIVLLLQPIRTLPDFVYFIAFLVGVVAPIGILFKTRYFLIRNYIVATIAIASCLASISYPSIMRANAYAHSMQREQDFSGIIGDVTADSIMSDLRSASRQSDHSVHLDAKGAALVLQTSSMNETFDLQPSLLEVWLPERLLAKDAAAIEWVVVHGPIGRITTPFGHEGEKVIGTPVVIYSWPSREKRASGLLSTTVNQGASGLWLMIMVDRKLGSQLGGVLGNP